MSTYRCAIDGLLPSEVCEYYRVDSRTCAAPDPDHCQDSLHDEDGRQREGVAEVSDLVGRLSVLQVLLAERHPDHHATVCEAIAEVRRLRDEREQADKEASALLGQADETIARLREREAKARELAERVVNGAPEFFCTEMQAIASDWSRWLAEVE